ncbi:type I secretion system permease/ATPase, partial [Rhodopseudomonas palustris]
MTTDPTVCALTAARRPLRPALAAALGFSAVVNLLMLTPALYMLQVYDRVLVSHSVPTLLALSLIAACLFIALGLLDHARARILARIGTRLQVGLQDRVFTAALRRGAVAPRAPAATEDDLDAYVRPWATPLAPALADLPWAPVFLLALFAFHPAMGALALAGSAT